MNYQDLTLDGSAKNILSNPYIAAAILKRTFPEHFKSLSLTEIVKNHLKISPVNKTKIDAKTEKVSPEIGKQTHYDLNIEAKLPPEESVGMVEIEFERNYSKRLDNREIVYMDKMVSSQYHKEYDDYSKVASVWIIMKPPEEKRNQVIVKLTQSFLNVKTEDGVEIRPLEGVRPNGLQRIVEFNIGGPEYPEFDDEVKLIFDLFHNNEEEVKNYFIKNGATGFNYQEVFKAMEVYRSLDDQVREEGIQIGIHKGKQEGIQEGIQIGMNKGKQEGIQEGRLEHAKEMYDKMIKDGFSPEVAHKYAFEN